jgi:hypothetical protein
MVSSFVTKPRMTRAGKRSSTCLAPEPSSLSG